MSSKGLSSEDMITESIGIRGISRLFQIFPGQPKSSSEKWS
jgi:hypothetical protein